MLQLKFQGRKSQKAESQTPACALLFIFLSISGAYKDKLA
jgi:hypothetical protein